MKAGCIRAFVLRSCGCRQFRSRSVQGLAHESAWPICSLFSSAGRVRLLRHVFRASRVAHLVPSNCLTLKCVVCR